MLYLVYSKTLSSDLFSNGSEMVIAPQHKVDCIHDCWYSFIRGRRDESRLHVDVWLARLVVSIEINAISSASLGTNSWDR